MAPAQKTATVILKYETDPKSVASVERANDAIASSIKDAGRDASRIGSGYRKLADGTIELVDSSESWANNIGFVNDELALTVSENKEVTNEIEKQADLTAELADAQDRYRKELAVRGERGGGSSSSTGGGGLTDRVDRFGAFGTQIASAFGGGEVGNVVGLVGDVAGGLGALGPIAVGATAALAGLSLAMAETERQSQILHDNTIARLTAERSAAQFAETATTEQLQARRAELQELAAAEAENIASLREQAIAFLFNENAVSRVTTQLGILNSNVGILNAYREQIAEGTTALAGYNAEQIALNEALLSGTRITNDAAEAERLLAEERGVLRNAEQQAFLEGTQLTDAAIQDRINGITAERDAIERWIEIVQPQGEELDALNAEMDRLTSQIVGLTYSMENNGAADAKAAFDEAKESILETTAALAAEVEKRKEITEASRHYADQLNYEAKQLALRNEETAREDYVKSIAEEAKLAADAAEAHQKYREGLGDTAEQLAEAETERQLALSDIQDDYSRESVEAAEDLNDELVKITRDASDQLQDAVADRDALAFVQAKRQRDKDLQDAKADDEKESRRRQQEFQREYNEEVRASNIRYQHLLQSERRETETRYQAYQQSLQQLAQASGQKLNLEQQYNNATLAAAGNFANSLRTTYLSAFPTKGTIPTKGGGGKSLTIDFRGAQMGTINAASKQQAINEIGRILSEQYGVR